MIGISFLKIFLVAAILSLMLGTSFGQADCGNVGYCAQNSNPCPLIAGDCENGEKCCHDFRKLFTSFGEAHCGENAYCARLYNPCQQLPGTCGGKNPGKCCRDYAKFP